MAAALTLPKASQGLTLETIFAQMGMPQGVEDKQLRDNAQDAVVHWQDRAEYLLGVVVTAEDYVSVPFEFVKTVRVSYRDVGPLRPAPYTLDE